MSDPKYNEGMRLVAPILVQTDIGEVEGRVGDYLVITGGGRQVVMSEEEYLKGLGNGPLEMPADSGESNYPEMPDSSISPDQLEKGPGGLKAILGKFRREKVGTRTIVSVTEEGFREVLSPREPAVLEEGIVLDDDNHSEIPNSSVQPDPLKKSGFFRSLFRRQKTEPAPILEGPEASESSEMVDVVSEVVLGVSDCTPGPEADRDEPLPALAPETETAQESSHKESYLESVLAGLEPKGMAKIPDREICHTLPLRFGPKVPVPSPYLPHAPEAPPAVDTEWIDTIFGTTEPAVAEGSVELDTDPEDTRITLTDQANRDLGKLERAALANLAPPIRKKSGPLAALFPEKGVSSPKKGKKRSVVLPFQKKAAALIEPKKEKYEWVPVDWI